MMPKRGARCAPCRAGMSAPRLMMAGLEKESAMMIQTETARETMRDRTRRPAAKARTATRRAQRRDKSARLFLAFAFPADLSPFAGGSVH